MSTYISDLHLIPFSLHYIVLSFSEKKLLYHCYISMKEFNFNLGK